MILDDSDPGMVTELTLSPALMPARASVPPSPSSPLDLLPVVHCILPSAYRNITNDSTPLVARTHWKVLVYKRIDNENGSILFIPHIEQLSTHTVIIPIYS